MVPEARLEQLPEGLGAEGPGWFVLNARDARWWQREGLGRWADLEGDGDFEQLGMRIAVLRPGEPSGMYHGETGQEDFLVVSGECVLVIEGEERRLKAWDFVHCPPWTGHTFVGRGDGPCVIVTVGARTGDDEILYPVNEVAAKHGSSVEKETPEPKEAYAPYPRDPLFTPYREGDLSDF
ncbi:MAG: cupin domain-containing protein [Gaiellales bacterium]